MLALPLCSLKLNLKSTFQKLHAKIASTVVISSVDNQSCTLGVANSVVNAAVNSVDNGGVELTQRVIINSFDVDLNAIWQTTAEGTQDKRRDHNIAVSRDSSNAEKEKRK